MSNDEYPVAKFLRLKNGDDIVSDMVELSDDEYTNYHLINPLKVVYSPSTENGYLTVAFMPWVFPRIVEEQEFTLDGEDVLMVCDVSASMNDYYWKNVSHYVNAVKEAPFGAEEKNSDLSEEELQRLIDLMEGKRIFH